jgi:hypothetical protein
MSQRALFEGLIVDPNDQPVSVALVGGAAHYVVEDGGFKFHIDAEDVDRRVLRAFGEQIQANRPAVSEQTMKVLGQDDLFTKAAIDASLNHLDDGFNQLIAQGLPEGARQYLGLLGFRVVLNYHGEIERIDQPGVVSDEGE